MKVPRYEKSGYSYVLTGISEETFYISRHKDRLIGVVGCTDFSFVKSYSSCESAEADVDNVKKSYRIHRDISRECGIDLDPPYDFEIYLVTPAGGMSWKKL
jgi:hypothetical protein